MLDIFRNIYDTIFPPHESIKKLRNESEINFIRFFRPHRFINCISLSDYSNPTVKAAITANKFYDHDKASVLLSTLVEHWLQTVPDSPTIFIPIPLSTAREKERGYNQVSRILEKTKHKNIKVMNLLKRTKHTKPQTSLAREQRFKNMEGAFVFEKIDIDISKHRIVIVDDVITTSATMHAAYFALSMHLPKDCEIICLSIAH